MRIDRPDAPSHVPSSAPSSAAMRDEAGPSVASDSLTLGEAFEQVAPERKVRAAGAADTLTGAAVRAAQGKAVRPGLITAVLNSRISQALASSLTWLGPGSRLASSLANFATRLRVIPVVSAVTGTVFATHDTQTALREQHSPQVSLTGKTLNWARVAAGWGGVGLGVVSVGAGLLGAAPALVAGTAIAAGVVGLLGLAAGLARARLG
ncbi:MAG: hypothetical protein VKP62_11050 [Candidatus Sericytochromatia bacterium]|nr:hypothetical protein [Candidatus Sericytochromatia bacterium]